MTILSDYLRDVRKNLSHLSIRERDAVLKEIQDHLEAETKRLRKEDSSLSPDEAALKATNSFGAPEEIGIAYGAHGGIINRSTGERLLEVAVLTSRAAGRGVKGLLKWTGIVAASIVGIALVLLIAGLIFAGDVVETFQDDIREAVPRPLYEYEGAWSGEADAHTETTSQTFEVRQGMKEFTISIDIEPHPSATNPGCARVVLTRPSGGVAYDSGTDCGADGTSATFSEKGVWKVEYTYVAYQGSVNVEAYYFEDAPK